MRLQDRHNILCNLVSVSQAGAECARLAVRRKMRCVVEAAIAACRQPLLVEGALPAPQGQALAMQSMPVQAPRRACRSRSF